MKIINKSYTSSEIIKEIQKYNNISFDIFDTLVKRTVASPKDVFIRVAEDFNIANSNILNPQEFQKDRINAAVLAKSLTPIKGVEETSLDEIYDCLPDFYNDFSDRLKNLEIKIEIECCKVNNEVKKVFDWCLENKKTIYITSDMYLPKKVIETILFNCGYIGYKTLYLSSDVKLKKQTGNLYRYVAKQESIYGDSIIHVGDNFRIDYLSALRSKWHAIKIAKDVKRSQFSCVRGLKLNQKKEYLNYQKVIENFIEIGWDPYYQYGFEVVGILLYAFCTWLHECFTKQQCNKVYFLSRDGYLMQEAYNKIFGNNAVKNSYLYVSRKSLFVPQLWINPSLENIFEPETPYHYWNYEEVCELLNVEKNEGLDIWKKCGLSAEERFLKKELLEDHRIRTFFNIVKGAIISLSKEKYKDVIAYLNQEGFFGNVAIVDVGWAGAIQKYLQVLLKENNDETRIFGLYLGLKKRTVTGPNADSFIPKEECPNLFCSQLVEYPFTKCIGSTLSYKAEKDGTVLPTLMQYEFEGTKDKEHTEMMQKGAMAFIDLIVNGYGAKKIDYNVAYCNLKNVTKNPTHLEVDLLGVLKHVNHGQSSKLAEPSSIWHYLLHHKELKYDLSSSGWKIGFMKKLLKIPMPYNKILTYIRRAAD